MVAICHHDKAEMGPCDDKSRVVLRVRYGFDRIFSAHKKWVSVEELLQPRYGDVGKSLAGVQSLGP